MVTILGQKIGGQRSLTPGIEPGLPGWEAGILTSRPWRRLAKIFLLYEKVPVEIWSAILEELDVITFDNEKRPCIHHTHRGNLESWIKLMFMFLDCGKKLKESHTGTEISDWPDWESNPPITFPFLLKLIDPTVWPQMRSKGWNRDKNVQSCFRKSSDLRQSEPFLCKRLVNWPLFLFGWENYSCCMFS